MPSSAHEQTPLLPEPLTFPLSIAPMMDYTDRHFRMMMRLITERTLLYTEMVSSGAILHGDRAQHLGFSEEERPLILQVGGDAPRELVECARIAEDMGYDEINLNAGCPSDRVQKGSFGAALMATPELVGEIVSSMRATVRIPVSVKCRIGIDGRKMGMPTLTDHNSLANFANIVLSSGASRLSVHARIAILGGLTPKENREIPPLEYPLVYTLIAELKKNLLRTVGGQRWVQDYRRHQFSAHTQ